jgi:hypothetical protein
LRARIAAAEALTPRRVTLRLKDVSTADAVATLARTSGVDLLYDRQASLFDPGAKNVTLDLDGVLFWEALDRLCTAAGLSYGWGSEGPIRLTEGTPAPLSGLSYAGSVRLQATRVFYSRSRALGGKGTPALAGGELSFSVLPEPGTRVLGLGQPRLTEAVDEGGESLLPVGPVAKFGTETV